MATIPVITITPEGIQRAVLDEMRRALEYSGDVSAFRMSDNESELLQALDPDGVFHNHPQNFFPQITETEKRSLIELASELRDATTAQGRYYASEGLQAALLAAGG